MSKKVVALSAIAGPCLLAPTALAQCPQWLAGEGSPGLLGMAYASTMWDPDGAGPQAPVLVVGGSFTLAGQTLASNIASWDGSSWHALGSGTDQPVLALAVLPSGELVAGGQFTTAGGVPARNIARWNGAAWSPFGSGIGSGRSGGRSLAGRAGGAPSGR